MGKFHEAKIIIGSKTYEDIQAGKWSCDNYAKWAAQILHEYKDTTYLGNAHLDKENNLHYICWTYKPSDTTMDVFNGDKIVKLNESTTIKTYPAILHDIVEIFKDDIEHHVSIKLEPYKFTVYIDYDYNCSFEEKMIIPIVYDSVDEIIYISDKEYKERYQGGDGYGIDHSEIKLILRVMDYIENNKDYINELCNDKCCCKDRENDKEGKY